MAYNLNELAEKSGENQGSEFKFELPMLSIEGEDGYFRLMENKKETKIDGNVEGIMLRFRCQYGAYLNEGERILFTDEKDSASNVFDLIEITQGAKGKFTNKIDRGTGKELKERHPDLSFKQIVYFLYNGELVRLQIKGSSLSNLFRTKEQAEAEKKETGNDVAIGYFQQFGKDEHKFQYWTQIEPEKFEKKIGNKIKTFYKIKFIKGNKLSEQEMENVAEKINYIYDKIQSIEKAKLARDTQQPQAQPTEQDQPPVEAYDDGSNDYNQ